MPRIIRAVFFDFDGTLADSYRAITDSVNHVRGEHGMAPLPEEQVKRFVGRGAEHLLRDTVPGCDVDHAVASYRAHHPSVMLSGTRLLPGAEATIHALHRAGILLAICSNKPRDFTERIVEYLDLQPYFHALLGPEDVPHPKPAPDMLIAGLQRLAVVASEALYVGDMTIDIQTARAAGVNVWVVPTGSDTLAALESAGPDRILENLEEITIALSKN